MSGAGNDAPPINYIPSTQEPTHSDRTETFAQEDCGISFIPSNVAVRKTKEQDPKRTMDSDEDSSNPSTQHTPPKIRVYFDEFAAQIRLHKQQNRHARVLRLRQESLQKSVTLTQRLRRVARVAQDGLFDLSSKHDKAGFARVYHCVNDLTTTCHTRWTEEIQAYEISTHEDSGSGRTGGDHSSFVSRLSSESRRDLSKLLHSIRSEPKFLVDRIKALTHVQLEGICLHPGEEPQSSILPRFPQSRNSRSRSGRHTAFANSLEDFAISLERKEPLKFMLCNIFGDTEDLESPEHWLRLDTWSSVCAELFLDADRNHNLTERYHKLIDRILYLFASLQPWRVAERLERYFMDILQRGAVLLEAVDKNPTSTFRNMASEPLNTPEADRFFEKAVQELIEILCQHDGGIPRPALQFASAVVGKLPQDYQGAFRGHVLVQWFFEEFLASAISGPENENMLLNCHVSKHARFNILSSLSRRFNNRARDILSGAESFPAIPDAMRDQVLDMVNWLEPLDTTRCPFQAHAEDNPPAFIVICPTELITIIDTLCPLPGLQSTGGWDPFLMSTASAFQSQYARTNTNSRTSFEQLRRDLFLFVDQNSFSRLPHPTAERWTLLPISTNKQFDLEHLSWNWTENSRVGFEHCFEDNDATRQAAIRLACDYRKSYRHSSYVGTDELFSSAGRRDNLLDLIDNEYRHAQDRADKVDARRWLDALKHLQDNYPLSNWAQNDTQALNLPLQASQSAQRLLEAEIIQHENTLLEFKDSYLAQRGLITQILARLDKLRNKLWYAVDVINSNIYEDARNIASALNSIASSILTPSESTSDGSDTASLAGSILSQSSRETVGMLKAPSEHGGPKKLADMQVDMIRKWMKRSNIENFCKGEERIHRFCMEIKLLAKRLVGETVTESPILWMSDLFAKERALCFETGNVLLGGFGGTGPPSIRSETMSSIYHSSRGTGHGESGSRMSSYESHTSPARKSSFHSFGSSRIKTDMQPTEGSSLNGSPDRAYSSTASDTVSSLASLYSPVVAHSQSATSISTRSRPPSTYNDVETTRLADQTAREKTKFLEELQQDLTCLLLSDLGCPVWSCGSETDAWLISTGPDSRVLRRLRQTETAVRLRSTRAKAGNLKKSVRSSSLAPLSPKTTYAESNEIGERRPISQSYDSFDYMEAYRSLLERCSQHINPMDKLQAIYDMKLLVIDEMKSTASEPSNVQVGAGRPSRTSTSTIATRRSSFDPSQSLVGRGRSPSNSAPGRSVDEPNRYVVTLQDILGKLRPKTLFRDLQYISVFVQQETLNKTERGKALTDFGLAALAYKADITQAIFDVAYEAFAEQSTRLSPGRGNSLQEPKLAEAGTFLLIAAREGNPEAQREVAGLYLSYPEMKQVISLPLSYSGDTFKTENEWQNKSQRNNSSSRNDDKDDKISSQAMCLALHWMKQAAANGDKKAKDELRKRDEGISIR